MSPIDRKTEAEKIKDEMLKAYPTKVARRRAKQIIINDVQPGEVVPDIKANTRTIPGIITMRGCAYAGCKGVVLGPTRDIVHIVHGPIGCSFYAWLTRRNQTRPETPEDVNYMPYALSTDMQEEQIIFGGEKKLKQAIDEAVAIFHPKAIGIYATCPVGLIGDDVHSVARAMEEKYPDINIFGFSCEGYKGVSQSAGHHIANNKVFTDVVGLNQTRKAGKFVVNLLGEYNIGGDAFELDRIFEKCGITVQATFSGNSVYDEFASAQMADLNMVMCHRSINYMADMMEKKYGIPWFKVNFIGAESSAKSLRKLADYYGDKELTARIEQVITEEMPDVKVVQKEVRARCEGKTAMMFVGGSRAHHYQDLFGEIGMKTLSAGYEFAHRDDYEGRKVLPSIEVDADTRNIEEITVKPDPENYRPRLSESEREALTAKGVALNDYEGMMAQMENNSLVIDDLNHHEAEVLIQKYHPDIFCAGVKEKYVVQKYGIPMKQLHSYDYSGPYAGFRGAINFYREIDRMINTKIWGLIPAPWDKEPQITGTYGTE
jgi:nitrogenase molybdenum-iron protein alpha chain